MLDLPKRCALCGDYYTETHDCRLLKTDYDRGYEAGTRAAGLNQEKHCPKCGKAYTGSIHLCLAERISTDYDRGYEDARKEARRELGCSGRDTFPFSGE